MNEQTNRTYLALGDSMSIDDYTGVEGGGAVHTFCKTLGAGWVVDDRTFDGCRIAGVPVNGHGDLITLTVGGNDLVRNRERYLREGVADFAAEHLELLERIRQANPRAVFIVGDIYAPASPLSDVEAAGLAAANAAIAANCQEVGAILAPIGSSFAGNEASFLCLEIEPTLQGAQLISRLFARAHASTQSS